MRMPNSNEPVVWHSVVATIIGLGSIWVPGLGEGVSVALTGIVAALARRKVVPCRKVREYVD